MMNPSIGKSAVRRSGRKYRVTIHGTRKRHLSTSALASAEGYSRNRLNATRNFQAVPYTYATSVPSPGALLIRRLLLSSRAFVSEFAVNPGSNMRRDLAPNFRFDYPRRRETANSHGSRLPHRHLFSSSANRPPTLSHLKSFPSLFDIHLFKRLNIDNFHRRRNRSAPATSDFQHSPRRG